MKVNVNLINSETTKKHNVKADNVIGVTVLLLFILGLYNVLSGNYKSAAILFGIDALALSFNTLLSLIISNNIHLKIATFIIKFKNR